MITAEFTIFNQYYYNNWENDSFWIKNYYYCAAEDQAQTFQWSYSYKLTAYHDATDQLQEHYDSITTYYNTEKFFYDQTVNQDHETESQKSDYNVKKLKQIKIDENLFINHIKNWYKLIIHSSCWTLSWESHNCY